MSGELEYEFINDDIAIQSGPDDKPYFRIDGREISDSGGTPIYTGMRRPEPMPFVDIYHEQGNHMHGNKVEWDKRSDGKWQWRIIAVDPGLDPPENVIAGDMNQGYENESDCLAGLFRVFFGSYDPTFLAAHSRWAEFADGGVEEPYVRTDDSDRAFMRDSFADAGNGEAAAAISAVDKRLKSGLEMGRE